MAADREYLTEAELCRVLRDACTAAGGGAQWAARHNFYPKTPSVVMRGEQAISPRLAEALGYERVVLFRKRQP
jgi:hypothetical protein